MSQAAHAGYERLQQAHLVLLAAQASLAVSIVVRAGADQVPGVIATLAAVSVVLLTMNRRIARDGPNRGAARWIVAWRSGVLAVLALSTLLVGLDHYRAPAVPETLRQLPLAALWIVISLKGAAVGKLKPGGILGLRVYWTLRSHLAWDRAHRTLGRILFWGGLIGLTVNPLLPPPASMTLWVAVVVTAVIMALTESRLAWRSDPERAS
jgi:uncharacterized membrane protein